MDLELTAVARAGVDMADAECTTEDRPDVLLQAGADAQRLPRAVAGARETMPNGGDLTQGFQHRLGAR